MATIEVTAIWEFKGGYQHEVLGQEERHEGKEKEKTTNILIPPSSAILFTRLPSPPSTLKFVFLQQPSSTSSSSLSPKPGNLFANGQSFPYVKLGEGRGRRVGAFSPTAYSLTRGTTKRGLQDWASVGCEWLNKPGSTLERKLLWCFLLPSRSWG